MVRVGGSQGGPPNFMGQNQLGQLGGLASGGSYGGFPPGLASLAGFNPASFLQQRKLTLYLKHFFLILL